MNPGRWTFHPVEQTQITNQRPVNVQKAVVTLMQNRGDALVEIALGQRQAGGVPMGGVVAAIESAVAQAIIFVLTNEDQGFVRRHRLIEGTPAEGLLVATVTPQEQARLAQEALKREDPKR